MGYEMIFKNEKMIGGGSGGSSDEKIFMVPITLNKDDWVSASASAFVPNAALIIHNDLNLDMKRQLLIPIPVSVLDRTRYYESNIIFNNVNPTNGNINVIADTVPTSDIDICLYVIEGPLKEVEENADT